MFSSVGKSITWHSVKGIADLLGKVACNGFAEFFAIRYKDDTGRIGAFVSLRFVDWGEMGGMARHQSEVRAQTTEKVASQAWSSLYDSCSLCLR